jgi:hypothetical protein
MAETEQLVNMWKEGMSAREIGEALGKTRGSVMGKIHRLRAKGLFEDYRCLGKKQPAASKNVIQFTKPPAQQKVFVRAEIEEIDEDVPEGLKLLFDLSATDCHYIVTRKKVGALYCGKDAHRRQMCAHHYSLCYLRLTLAPNASNTDGGAV